MQVFVPVSHCKDTHNFDKTNNFFKIFVFSHQVQDIHHCRIHTFCVLDIADRVLMQLIKSISNYHFFLACISVCVGRTQGDFRFNEILPCIIINAYLKKETFLFIGESLFKINQYNLIPHISTPAEVYIWTTIPIGSPLAEVLNLLLLSYTKEYNAGAFPSTCEESIYIIPFVVT